MNKVWSVIWSCLRGGLHRRTVLLSMLVGAVSALAAYAFLLGLEYASLFCQEFLMGLKRAAPGGEVLPGLPWTWDGVRPALILLLPPAGALAGSWLALRFAPSAAGNGMDATIRAFHQEEGRVPLRVSLVKTVATICTLGAGGSGGREGPIAQISAGFGSWLADRLRLSSSERRTFMLAGAAGGIGAIFRTPLGGAVSAVEILYREDIESPALIPCVVSSVTGYTLFTVLLGLPFPGITSLTLFRFPSLAPVTASQYIFVLPFGLACAALGWLHVRVFHFASGRFFPSLPVAPLWRPVLGAAAVGVLGLACHSVLGTGIGLIQTVVDAPAAVAAPERLLWLAAAFIGLALCKILATACSIGSGGSGGIFGPTILIGGLLGGATGCLLRALVPELHPPAPEVFVCLGMAGFFAGVAKAPIGAVIMVTEMTSSYSLLAPLLVVCVVSVLLQRGYSIYRNQVENRFASPAYRHQLAPDVLGGVQVNACYHRTAMPVVRDTATAAELRALLANENVLFPLTVVDADGLPCGMLTMGSIRPVYFTDAQHDLFLVRDMMTPLVICHPDEALGLVLRRFEGSSYSRLPVVSREHPGDLLGYIQYQDIMIAYETELARRRA
jgi:CIC family chloride channel protein